MNKLIGFTSGNGKVAIPTGKITGITETDKKSAGRYKTFIATGADSDDGCENGWYVFETYSEAYILLEDALKD